MTVARLTQEAVETLSTTSPKARVTQSMIEVLSANALKAMATQVSVEVLSANALYLMTTQVVIEVLSPYVPYETIIPESIPSAEAFGTPESNAVIVPVSIPSAEAFGSASIDTHIVPTSIDSAEAFGAPALSLVPSQMKSLFEVLLPPGAIWRPREGGDFDKLLNGMGYNIQETYNYADDLAHVRDPRATTLLSDLEKEYGISTNTTLTEAARRIALAALKYAVPNTASWAHLQASLRAAGFTGIVVTPNDPAIDPALITGTPLVNGPVYSAQSPAYLMECNGDFAYAGNGKAVCGYYVNIKRTDLEYPLPAQSIYWRFIFFVGGAATGWPGSPAIARYTVPAGRLEELKRLILRYKPMRSWCILNAGY